MTITYLFVGEMRNISCLCEQQLFDALRENGIDPHAQEFDNVFFENHEEVNPDAVRRIRRAYLRGLTVVAMGYKAKKQLTLNQIEAVAIPHPAARGAIRAKATYARVVGRILKGRSS